MRTKRRTWGWTACLLVPALAQAGRPLVTDDASILDPGFCQVEAWVDRHTDSKEYWAVPHCHVGRNWELSGGVGQARPPGFGVGTGLLQAKTVFRPLAPNDWAIGLTLTDQFHRAHMLTGDLSVVVPLSVSLLDDQLRVHANAGWLRASGSGSGATWALAGEWNATARAGLTLEAYGSGHGPTYVQAGARYDVVPQRVTLDVAVGDRIGLHGGDRYVAFGITVVFARH